MRLRCIVGSLAYLAASCLCVWASGQERIPPQPVSGLFPWVYDYAEGKEEARKSGKPMFVVFRCER
jgi:hypothetical protein